MARTIRWGILGTGNIARQFAAGMKSSRRGIVSAVGSRTQASAATFAGKHEIAGVADSYADLIARDDVDAIYNALPNSMHHEWTIAALRAGKHVLCEKPIATNAAEAEEMFDVAERAGRVLVEAFMYRSQPFTLAVADVVGAGAIGRLKIIRTSFCYRTLNTTSNIRFSADLAGGALMDIGCYCINFSRFFAGAEPTECSAVGHLDASGIDDYCSATMRFENGVIASFTCGMTVQADNTAYLCGDEGYIEIPIPWKPPSMGATYTVARSTPPRMDQAQSAKPAPPPREMRTIDAGSDLYAIEADDFAAAVLDGATPRISRADSLGNMRVLDTLRRQLGVKGFS